MTSRRPPTWLSAWGLHGRSLGASLGTPLGTVLLESFGSRLAFGIVSFALPLYASSLGMSVATIGALLATNLGVAIALKPVVGQAVDRFGVRRAYLVAVVLRTLALLLVVFAVVPWQLFAIRALHGLSIALRDPAAASVLAGLGGKQAVASRFAWFQTTKTVAGSAGRFLSGVLITLVVGNYAAVFVVAAALSAWPVVLVLWRLTGAALAPLTATADTADTAATSDKALSWRRLLPYAGLGYLTSGTAYLMANLLPVFAVEYAGVPAAAAGALYLLTAVVGLSGPVWGWLADHGHQRWVLRTRATGNAVSSVIWLLFPSYAGLVAGKALDDLGKAAFRPAWGAVMAGTAEQDPRRRASTLSRLSAAEDLGEMTGPIVAGLVWSMGGPPAVLALRIGLALATEAYTYWLPTPTAGPDAGLPRTRAVTEDGHLVSR